MGDLEALSADLTAQLTQLEEVILINRTNRELILSSNPPQGEMKSAIRRLDLLYLQSQ